MEGLILYRCTDMLEGAYGKWVAGHYGSGVFAVQGCVDFSLWEGEWREFDSFEDALAYLHKLRAAPEPVTDDLVSIDP